VRVTIRDELLSSGVQCNFISYEEFGSRINSGKITYGDTYINCKSWFPFVVCEDSQTYRAMRGEATYFWYLGGFVRLNP